ncbi:MAG: hypothetical protein Q4A79_01650 [Candidatus Saccharibacteria bacterium]|nr:hypothetical protein [Candidatus Saccharibacteria bacterium]
MTRGGKNLLILGLSSVLIAITTTGISLMIYHNSGDIYLDRSRPGFLPDEDESEENNQTDYEFSKSGPINREVLEGYLDALEAEVEALEVYEEPFSAEALSDKRLGID